MTERIKFDEQALNKVEEDYSRLEVPESTRQTINYIAQIYAQHIPMREIAIRGFIMITLKEFQIEHKIKAQEIRTLPVDEQNRLNSIIADMIFDKMSKVLYKQEDKVHLREGINEAVKVFKSGNL